MRQRPRGSVARRVRRPRWAVLARLGGRAPVALPGRILGRGRRGRFPAIALDRNGRPADTVTSNLGHLLGTGLLDPDETAAVVRRLAALGSGQRFRVAHHVGARGRLQPAELSLRVGLAARHRDRDRRLVGLARTRCRGRGPKPHQRTTCRRTGVRRPAAGTLRRAGRRRPRAAQCPTRRRAGRRPGRLRRASSWWRRSWDWRPMSRPDLLRIRPMRPSPVGELTIRGLRVADEPLHAHG